MVLEAIGYGAGVRAGVNFKTVRDSVVVEDIVELRGVEPQAVLIAYVHCNGAVLPQIADILVDKGQR